LNSHPERHPPERVQLQLVLSFRRELGTHPTVRHYLASGFRVAQFSRVTDREVLVTFERTGAVAAG
jgi:hypothetical protein